MKQHVRASFQQIHPSCELQNLPVLKSFHFQTVSNVSFIYCDSCSAFEICFVAVVMVFGGVSLLTNGKLYQFSVKPRFELVVFPAVQSRLLVCGALPETAKCLDDFETMYTVYF